MTDSGAGGGAGAQRAAADGNKSSAAASAEQDADESAGCGQVDDTKQTAGETSERSTDDCADRAQRGDALESDKLAAALQSALGLRDTAGVGGDASSAANGERAAAAAVADTIAGADGGAASHRFWSTQPVPHYSETHVGASGPIDESAERDPRSVPSAPPALLPAFHWCTLDIDDPSELDELYTLLNENYVEDDDALFRFDYSRAFLRWALQPPGWRREWHVGVRVRSSGRLVAFISAVPTTLRVRSAHALRVVEVNFLCVHKKLRSKRLAPVLIREITRRANQRDIYQAVYTAGVVLPRPLAKCRYWHRSLNAKKLIEAGFSRLQPRMTMSRTIRLYALPEETAPVGAARAGARRRDGAGARGMLQPMERRHCAAAHALLMRYLRRHFQLHVQFTRAEFDHWFLPRDGVVYTFVVEAPTGAAADDDGVGGADEGDTPVSDLVSFYSLPSSIIADPKHSTLHAAYAFYNVTNEATRARPGQCAPACWATDGDGDGDGSDTGRDAEEAAQSSAWRDLMRNALVLAKQRGFDVFNALHLMHNMRFLRELKFAPGDGELHYYLYNWRTSIMACEENGLVML